MNEKNCKNINLKSINKDDNKNIREIIKDISLNKLYGSDFNIILYDHSKQVELLNNLYLNENKDFIEKKILISELKNKINNYKFQDKRKNIHDKLNLISLDNLIQKLYNSKLKCYYCKNNVFIFYKNVRDKNQWTLDRINNLDEHTNDNTVICCYDCNVKRRRVNSNKFLFTKNLTIIKE